MSRAKRARRSSTLLVLTLVGCTSLTKVDWSRIPAPEAASGTSTGGGIGAGGEGQGGGPVITPGASGEAGALTGGEGGQGGAAGGAAGAGGEGGDFGGGEIGGTSSGGNAGSGGTGGSSGGSTPLGGSAGTSGASGTGGGGAVAPKCSTYPQKPATVDLSGKIVMFDSGPQPASVAWGGRTGLDGKCKSAANALGISKQVVHAFLTADVSEELTPGILGNYAGKFALPTTPSIVSPFGITIVDNASLLTNFKVSLICAGVVQADVDSWLSGVKDGGVFDPLLSCAGWTLRNEDVNVRANVGLTDTTNTLFHDNMLADHWVSCLNSTAHVLCLGWDN